MASSYPTDFHYWKTEQIKKELNQCLFKAGYMPHPVIYKRIYVIKADEEQEEQYYLKGSSENENGQFLLKASLIEDDLHQCLLLFETCDKRSEERRYTPVTLSAHPLGEFTPLWSSTH